MGGEGCQKDEESGPAGGRFRRHWAGGKGLPADIGGLQRQLWTVGKKIDSKLSELLTTASRFSQILLQGA